MYDMFRSPMWCVCWWLFWRSRGKGWATQALCKMYLQRKHWPQCCGQLQQVWTVFIESFITLCHGVWIVLFFSSSVWHQVLFVIYSHKQVIYSIPILFLFSYICILFLFYSIYILFLFCCISILLYSHSIIFLFNSYYFPNLFYLYSIPFPVLFLFCSIFILFYSHAILMSDWLLSDHFF